MVATPAALEVPPIDLNGFLGNRFDAQDVWLLLSPLRYVWQFSVSVRALLGRGTMGYQ